MNQRSADDYGAAIRRGDPRLYIECIRLLGRDFENATLSDWKKVAQQAVTVRHLTREVRAAPETGLRSGYSYRSSQQPTQMERPSVQNMVTQDSDAAEPGSHWTPDEAEEDSSTAIQAVDTRRHAQGTTSSSESKRGVQLSEDMRKQLMAKGLCFSCYKRGHRARDTNECPNKGKRATRLPTKEELNA
jgi:hypothetical protein